MKDIKDITKEDLLSSDDILCEVFEQEDEIYKAKLLATLADHAKSLGIKTAFESLVKAYKKQLKEFNKTQQAQQQQSDGFTHFSNSKYPDMRCGAWIADDSGIKMHTQRNGEVTVFPHPILPVQMLKNVNTGYMKVKLVYKIRDTWEEIIVSKDEICSSNKILILARNGIEVTSENARSLVKYLSDLISYNRDIVDIQISTSKLGWVKKEFMPYCTNIVFDNESRFKEAFESIHEEGNAHTWYDLVKEIRKSDRFEPKIYLAASLASALVEPLNALPFVVNLWGDTGKGKTVVLMLAASIWANPMEEAYLTDPKSTPTALELRLDFLNNLPMLIDDMAQVKEKYHGNFSELVYYLCSGTGKDRANATLGLRAKTRWRNCILTNGEHSLVTETMQGGAVNRIIDVEMEDGLIFQDGNKVVSILKENYGFAGREFIEVVRNIGFDKIKEIQQDFAQKISDIAKASNIEKEQKQILPMSIILTADQIATDYIFKDDVYLDLEACVAILKSVGEVSENDRAYEWIMSEVAVHMNNFKPDITGAYRGECWGVIEDGYVCIAINIFNGMCDRGNFSRKSFLNWADKNNMLNTDKGRKDKTKRLNGSPTKCISMRVFEDNVQEKFMELTKDEQEKLPFL
ncbi:DUF927 domain-containing protein [Anaerosporobacter faecicola]|uniref:DUF927 domain-containing protein n=1 Tax=Anaerosporobacter faecicola TaxID=2718714 RepID=UPI00143B22DC|nr:DUF927 domain-containing protein [Anaerosporobacter faecicola]